MKKKNVLAITAVIVMSIVLLASCKHPRMAAPVNVMITEPDSVTMTEYDIVTEPAVLTMAKNPSSLSIKAAVMIRNELEAIKKDAEKLDSDEMLGANANPFILEHDNLKKHSKSIMDRLENQRAEKRGLQKLSKKAVTAAKKVTSSTAADAAVVAAEALQTELNKDKTTRSSAQWAAYALYDALDKAHTDGDNLTANRNLARSVIAALTDLLDMADEAVLRAALADK